MRANSNQISNTGDLRRFIVSTMEQVSSGDIELDKAQSITRLASQVNESFYSEIKTARFLKDAGKDIPKLGTLALG